jgi:hypothetical protein
MVLCSNLKKEETYLRIVLLLSVPLAPPKKATQEEKPQQQHVCPVLQAQRQFQATQQQQQL